MSIKNVPTITDNEKVNINRSQAEHRATWFGLMYDEMRKAGVDADTITREAVKRTGQFHGENIWKKQIKDLDDMTQFDAAFFNDLGKATFEMVTESTADDAKSEFHYCPLVAAWQKLGFDDETISKLCDLAMQGDRSIAEELGYKLDITDTIADGCATCKLHFYKK